MPFKLLGLVAADRVELLVDERVDARDEERGDRVDVERLALGVAALEAADVGARDGLVGLDREQQRDVDVDALIDRLLDRVDALGRARDLDHHVRAIDRLPVVAGRRDRAVGVARQVRSDLERDEAVTAAGLLVHRGEHITGRLHVGHGERVVDLLRALVGARHLLDRVVVVGGAEDRLLEDRRVRGHAAQALLLDHALELTTGDQRAPELVEPDAHSRLGERLQLRVHIGQSAHRVPVLSDRLCALYGLRAASTTCSGVIPKCLKTSSATPEAPKLCMPIASPRSPIQRCQPNVAAASIETRALTDGGSTWSRYSAGCSAKCLCRAC